MSTYLITASGPNDIFELGVVYGLLQSWNLSLCTQDSEFWKLHDYERERKLGVLEFPMDMRVTYDNLKLSKLDCCPSECGMTVCFEATSDNVDFIQKFINALADGYDVNYSESLIMKEDL